jgi:hypothetical protein
MPTLTIRPNVHRDWLINRLKEQSKGGTFWVIWWESSTMHSVGIDEFNTPEDAIAFMEQHRPESTELEGEEGREFDRELLLAT